MLQVTGETLHGIHLFCLGFAHAEKHKQAENGSAKNGAVCKGEFDKTGGVASMLTDLHWNTLQVRKMQSSRTVMLYSKTCVRKPPMRLTLTVDLEQ